MIHLALKDLGIPKGEKENIQVFNGPYGLYVKQGKINASLPEGKTAEDINLEEAINLLASKKKGKKTATKIKVVAIIAKVICFDPLYAATSGVSPFSILV